MHVTEVLQRVLIQESTYDIKCEATVGRMVGELGFYSDIKTGYSVLTSNSCSSIFDATTQHMYYDHNTIISSCVY